MTRVFCSAMGHLSQAKGNEARAARLVMRARQPVSLAVAGQMPKRCGIAIYRVISSFPRREMVMMSDASKNIDALAEGVRKQREIAKDAIDATKKIDDILSQTDDPEVKKKLEEAKQHF